MDVTMVDNAAGNPVSSVNIFQPSQTSDAGPMRNIEHQKEDSGAEKTVSKEMMKKIAESVQEQISLMNSSLSFQTYGKDNDKIAIIVSDKDTGKVIREIPAKEVRQMQEKLDELIGLIYNGSA